MKSIYSTILLFLSCVNVATAQGTCGATLSPDMKNELAREAVQWKAEHGTELREVQQNPCETVGTDKADSQFNINDVILDALVDTPASAVPGREDDELAKKQFFEHITLDVMTRGFNPTNYHFGVGACKTILKAPIELLVPEYVSYNIKGNEWISYKMSYWNAHAELLDSQQAARELDQALVKQFGNKLICAMVVSRIALTLQSEYEAGQIKTEDDFYDRARVLKDTLLDRTLSTLPSSVALPAKGLATGFSSSSFIDSKIVATKSSRVPFTDVETMPTVAKNHNTNRTDRYLISDFNTATAYGVHLGQSSHGVSLTVDGDLIWSNLTIKGKDVILAEENKNYSPKHHKFLLTPDELHQLLD